MKLSDLLERRMPPEPWEEGDKIPWNDPEFSRRMLEEHLSQAHDAASRTTRMVDAHVRWIHEGVMDGKAGRILDLGCGPGLYASRLAQLGHECVGIDFSPASIVHARQTARREQLNCSYLEENLLDAQFGSDFSLVLLVFGELNVFRRSDALDILTRARAALKPGGEILLEVHPQAELRRLGLAPPSWHTVQSGLFSDRPYLRLDEHFWDEARSVVTDRYYIVDAESGELTRHAASVQSYTEEGYAELLRAAGFEHWESVPSLQGPNGPISDELMVLRASSR